MLFRNIPGYSSVYSVSQTGVVRGPRKILKQQINDGGYKTAVVVNDEGKAVKRKTSRLVALAWIRNPNPVEAPWVDHINRDRVCNDVDNLRWISPVCNALNNDSDACHKTNNKTNPFRARIRVDGKTIELGYYKTRKEASSVARELRENILNIRLRALYYEADSRSPSFM